MEAANFFSRMGKSLKEVLVRGGSCMVVNADGRALQYLAGCRAQASFETAAHRRSRARCQSGDLIKT
jgi:hypothetical protein